MIEVDRISQLNQILVMVMIFRFLPLFITGFYEKGYIALHASQKSEIISD